MPITQIEFMPRKDAVALKPKPHMALISITEPDSAEKPEFRPGWEAVLRVQFWDVEKIEEDFFEPINEQQAVEIARFIELQHDKREDIFLIVHCLAGISRSAAVALAAWEYTGKQAEFPSSIRTGRRNSKVFRMVMDRLDLQII